MTSARLTDAQVDEIKARNPCDQVAAQWVTLRRHGRKMIGPCPLHSPNSQARDSTAFECDADGWVCAVCCDGGDVIKLVQCVEQLDFTAAIERLGGRREVDPEQAAERERVAAERRAQREQEANSFRERERATLWEMWLRGRKLPDTTAQAYLQRRCLDVPPTARLRAIEAMPYYADGTKGSEIIHRGPALLAAIIGRDNRFAGVHITYLDLEQTNGKATIFSPSNEDEKNSMPAKKVRGSKSGGRIELHRPDAPTRLFIGEGIETVLSVYTALTRTGRDLSATAFWSAIDLGNLGGRAESTLAHPTAKSPAGRAVRVPGPRIDTTSPGIPIPYTIKEVIILGDGDSDPFLTRCAIARAAARFWPGGRTVRVAWAPDGQDFNDLLRAAA